MKTSSVLMNTNLFLSHQMPSSSGLPGQGKKIGHRGVDASGETTYKKVLQTVNGYAVKLNLHIMVTENSVIAFTATEH